MSDETKAQRQEFAKEIISYLSKEIETVNNGMMGSGSVSTKMSDKLQEALNKFDE